MHIRFLELLVCIFNLPLDFSLPDLVIVHFLLLQADIGDDEMTNGSDDNGFLELSFEYLVAKDKLKWITITSDQVCVFSCALCTLYIGCTAVDSA